MSSPGCAAGRMPADYGGCSPGAPVGDRRLYRCDGGEETDRFVADDPRLEQFLAGRTSNEDEPPPRPGDRDRDPEGTSPPQSRPGTSSAAPCRPAVRGSNRCRRSRCRRWPPSRRRAGCWPRGRPFSHEVYEAAGKPVRPTSGSCGRGWPSCAWRSPAERGNQTGALRLLGRAHRRLETYAARPLGPPTAGPEPHRRVDLRTGNEPRPRFVVDGPPVVRTPTSSRQTNAGVDLPRVAWRPLALLVEVSPPCC